MDEWMEEELVQEGQIFSKSIGINWIALLANLWKKKWWIIGGSLLIAAATAFYSTTLPNVYRSTTTLLPVSAESGGQFSQYASMAAIAGISLPTETGTEVTKILAVLNSRTLKERVIEELDLYDDLLGEAAQGEDSLYSAVRVLSRQLFIYMDNQTGILSISMNSGNPVLAADTVNYVAIVLSSILDEKNLTALSHRMALSEKALNERRAELDRLKNRLMEFQREANILTPESQAEGHMQLYSSLIEQRMNLEVELETLRSALSENNPRIRTKEQELDAIQNQLKNLTTSSNEQFDTSVVSTNLVTYQEISAELELAQRMYLAALTQWEQVNSEEQSSRIYVEVIDKAIVPEEKIAPMRTQMVIMAGMAGAALLSFFIAICIPFYKYKKNEILAILNKIV